MKISNEIPTHAFAAVAAYMARQQSETIQEAIDNLCESSGIIAHGKGETATHYTTVFYPQGGVLYVFTHNADMSIDRVMVDGEVSWGCKIDENLDIINGTEREL